MNAGPLRKIVSRETYFPPKRLKITLECGHWLLVNKASQPGPTRRCILCATENKDDTIELRGSEPTTDAP